jgi:GntR family transcriptional regulator/MocR family aminotransferase
VYVPGARARGVAAGLHAIVALPERYGPQSRLLSAAGAAGLRLRPLSDYRFAGCGPHDGGERGLDDDGDSRRDGGPGGQGGAGGGGPVDLVVGYAHLTAEAIASAVRLLSAAAR